MMYQFTAEIRKSKKDEVRLVEVSAESYESALCYFHTKTDPDYGECVQRVFRGSIKAVQEKTADQIYDNVNGWWE